MLKTPEKLKSYYLQCLMDNNLPRHDYHFYQKWLRFYLDFCDKYKHSSRVSGSLTLFTDKLKSKGQSDKQVNQATIAIKIYYKLITKSLNVSDGKADRDNDVNVYAQDLPSNDASVLASAMVPNQTAWQAVYEGLRNEIQVRHYSPKTFKSYNGYL